MTRNLVVLVIILLVALAGFIGTGLATSPQADATTAPTMPAESLTKTPCGQENETTAFPPGASDSGIDNSTRLVATHQAVLKNTSYRDRSEWDEISRISAANETVRDFEGSQYTITVEKGVNGTEVIFEAPNASNAYWFTDDATVTNISSQSDGTNSTIYQYSRGSDYRDTINRDLPNFSSILVEPYLRDLEYDLVETTTRNNRTLYTYTSTGINETVEANHGDTPVVSTTETINATVVVSERGVIHSFTAQETHAVQNETVIIEQNYTVEGIGETNVSAPAWVTEELAQVNVSLNNRSVVEITHIGGISASDPPLFVHSSSVNNQTTINGTIESGDTVYVYFISEDGSNPALQTSINEQPSVNSSFVNLPEGNLSVLAWKSLIGSHDSGLTLEVTIRENPRNSTARNATSRSPQNNSSLATSSAEMWNQTYGGNGSQSAHQIVNATDNEYILIGSAVPSDSFDGWAALINADGKEQWNRSYGTEETDFLRAGVQTDDGYLLVGKTGSTEGKSDPDAWLLKVNNSGHEQWNTSYGGQKGDGFVSIIPTTDNGYLLGGNTCSVGTDCTAWVIKVDASGTEVWNRTIGQGYTRAYDVIGTRDGGFLLTGVAAAGQYNFEGWAAKLNATGYEQWNQTYGGGSFEDSVQTRDGGYALTGSRSPSSNRSDTDMWLVKLTETGLQEWQQTYGWQENDQARSIVQTPDGGFALAGSMIPPEMSGLTTEFGVVKTDGSGSEQWRWTDGTPWGTAPGVDVRNLRDDAYSITLTSNGDYIVAGQAQRPDDDEAWVVRLSPERDTPNRSARSHWKRPS